MKFAKITYRKLKGDPNWNLILESKEDVIMYFDAYSKDFSEKAVQFWFKAKKEAMGSLSRLGHFIENPTEAIAFSEIQFAIEGSEGSEVTLPEFCNRMDRIQIQKFETMLKMISKGQSVRLNAAGGYSGFDLDFYEIIEEREINEGGFLRFVQGKDFNSFTEDFNEDKFFENEIIEIDSKTIVIENDNMLSEFMMQHIEKKKDVQVILSFASRTSSYTKVDFFNMFEEGIKKDLRTIIVETTLIKKEQFNLLKQILEKVALNAKVILKIVIFAHTEEDISSDSEFIKLQIKRM